MVFQQILLYMMNICYSFVFVASRGIGKTFLIAIFCVIRCILYPGSKICIASGNRGQAIGVLEKIKMELMPMSEALRDEIKDINLTPANAAVLFHNGSYIKVVTASDSSRGNRANILVIDEYRMVKKDTIDAVLTKFLTSPRRPGYLNNPQYKHLAEPNKQLYLSSAYYKSHWSYQKMCSATRAMLNEKPAFVCGLPYQLPLSEGLFLRDSIESEMSEADFNEVKWQMEMECLWFGDSDGDFFNFEDVNKCRVIDTYLPSTLASRLGDKKYFIPIKQPGEIRILSGDIALMSSKRRNNDATAIFLNCMRPGKTGKYSYNIHFADAVEGEHSEDQAIRIYRLFNEFDCDYIVLDVKGPSVSISEYLVRDLIDPETGETYPALSCCNNEEIAMRCKSPNARKAIWAINGTAQLNSDCALTLREGFRTGKVKLLRSELEAESAYKEKQSFAALSSYEQVGIQAPYINTTLLVNELINLQHDESTGKVKLMEKPGARKDRYSSLSYNVYVASILERDLLKPARLIDPSQTFIFRQPQLFKSERW